MRRRLLTARAAGPVAGLLVLVSGCAGESAFVKCVDHSVEEGVDRSTAEQACEAAVGDDR